MKPRWVGLLVAAVMVVSAISPAAASARGRVADGCLVLNAPSGLTFGSLQAGLAMMQQLGAIEAPAG
jgi:hypothetical protein